MWAAAAVETGPPVSRGLFGGSSQSVAERAPASADTFPSHPSGDLGTDLCCVEFRLAEGTPHDDFCRLRPIGLPPQIKMGNDLIESLEEGRNRFRVKGSIVVQHALQWQGAGLQVVEGLAASRLRTAPGLGCNGARSLTVLDRTALRHSMRLRVLRRWRYTCRPPKSQRTNGLPGSFTEVGYS